MSFLIYYSYSIDEVDVNFKSYSLTISMENVIAVDCQCVLTSSDSNESEMNEE